MKEYYKPYFLSGNKKYIERGDIFAIEYLEMFILNSYPENGFISGETNIMLKLGLNKEKCLEKINNADNRFAYSLLHGEDNLNEFDLSQFHQNHNYHTNSAERYLESLNRIRTLDVMLQSGIGIERLNCKIFL